MRPVSRERAHRTARNNSTEGARHATHFFERHYAGGGTAGGRGRGRRPTERTTHEVPGGRGGVGRRVPGQVRGERVAGAQSDHDERGPREENPARKGDPSRLDG